MQLLFKSNPCRLRTLYQAMTTHEWAMVALNCIATRTPVTIQRVDCLGIGPISVQFCVYRPRLFVSQRETLCCCRRTKWPPRRAESLIYAMVSFDNPMIFARYCRIDSSVLCSTTNMACLVVTGWVVGLYMTSRSNPPSVRVTLN